MNRILVAVAMAIALPGAAYAQSAPAEKPKMACCEEMKDKCPCCEKMAAKPAGSTDAPSSDSHAGHDKPAAPGATSHH